MPCQAHFTFTSLVWKRYQQSSNNLLEKRETNRTEDSTRVPWRKPWIRCTWWQIQPLTTETHIHTLRQSCYQSDSLIITLKLRRYTRGSRRVTFPGFYTEKDLHTKICTTKVCSTVMRAALTSLGTCLQCMWRQLKQRRQKRQLRPYLPRVCGPMGQADGRQTHPNTRMPGHAKCHEEKEQGVLRSERGHVRYRRKWHFGWDYRVSGSWPGRGWVSLPRQTVSKGAEAGRSRGQSPRGKGQADLKWGCRNPQGLCGSHVTQDLGVYSKCQGKPLASPIVTPKWAHLRYT